MSLRFYGVLVIWADCITMRFVAFVFALFVIGEKDDSGAEILCIFLDWLYVCLTQLSRIAQVFVAINALLCRLRSNNCP